MNTNYRRTMYAGFIGYIVQAIVNNFVPLLFVTFQADYGIPLSKITMLITVNFVIQLLVDLLSAVFIDRIGYKASVLIAHGCAAAGLICLAVLPDMTADPYAGLLAGVVIYAVGGGLIEVLISPIIEACPTENKEKAMSLLHSFYCWGHVGVVLLSTLFFALAGIENWKILTFVWALIPIANGILFAGAPVRSLSSDGEEEMGLRSLLSSKIFWIMMLMMVCAGASVQAVSQWTSTFAEEGLGVSKAVGDLAGPMAFAFFMGTSRLIYGKFGHRLNLDRFMMGSCILCILSYLWISLIPVPFLGLAGCAACGFSVGILWPGSFSKAAAAIRGGGTMMFALLALAGDLGCSGGPTFAGLISSRFGNDLHKGILAAIIFPVLLLIGMMLHRRTVSRRMEA